MAKFSLLLQFPKQKFIITLNNVLTVSVQEGILLNISTKSEQESNLLFANIWWKLPRVKTYLNNGKGVKTKQHAKYKKFLVVTENLLLLKEGKGALTPSIADKTEKVSKFTN